MKILSVAAMAGLAAATIGHVEVVGSGSSEGVPMLYSNRYRNRPGKGKNRRPRHSSSRFVAMDKRDARKSRNRRGS